MRRRPPRSTRVRSSAASDVYKRQVVIDLYWMGIDAIEPASNIYAKELVIRNVMGGYPARFDFVENTTCITDIAFDPLMTFRKTITTAEVLKGISVFVQELPTGRIYQYTDIFVGDKGAGLPTPVSYTHLRAHETVLDLVC